jgi:uncharacterized protein (TIGR03435 family)
MVQARLLGAVGIVAVVGGIAGVLKAQTPASPAFEVASVKPNKTVGPLGVRSLSGDRATITNASLRTLIQAAYAITVSQIIGGPNWIDSERFDIHAKALAPTFVSQLQLMLRTLLLDRFKLVVHAETRQLPIYTLVVARSDGKLGPSLRRSDIDCVPILAASAIGQSPTPAVPGKPAPCAIESPWPLAASAITMAQLTDYLSPRVQRDVLDGTRLTGYFDVELIWTPELPSAIVAAPRPPGEPLMLNNHVVDLNGPSIFTALQEQLGLKLDSEGGPVDVLVIDHVEHPTED